jgi:hypothetical protein
LKPPVGVQAIGSKIKSQLRNRITDFWKGVRRATDLRRGCYHVERNCAVARLGYRIRSCLLCESLVHRGRSYKRLRSSNTALTIWHATGSTHLVTRRRCGGARGPQQGDRRPSRSLREHSQEPSAQHLHEAQSIESARTRPLVSNRSAPQRIAVPQAFS